MYNIPTLQELLEAGVHFGHKISRGHPRMKPFIYGAKDGVHIIDLTIAEKYLKEALEYVYKCGAENKVVLFVGTKKQARPIVEELCKKIGAPFLTTRWMGGFLTNFEQIQKNNVKKLKDLTKRKEAGELAIYTKKEQLLMDRLMQDLYKQYNGVLNMEKLPDVVFVLDAVTDNIAVKEANRLKIPVVAVADSNANPDEINYPIPGNDDAIKAIKILTEAVAGALEAGMKDGDKIRTEQKEKLEKEKAKEEAKEAATKKEIDKV